MNFSNFLGSLSVFNYSKSNGIPAEIALYRLPARLYLEFSPVSVSVRNWKYLLSCAFRDNWGGNSDAAGTAREELTFIGADTVNLTNCRTSPCVNVPEILYLQRYVKSMSQFQKYPTISRRKNCAGRIFIFYLSFHLLGPCSSSRDSRCVCTRLAFEISKLQVVLLHDPAARGTPPVQEALIFRADIAF